MVAYKDPEKQREYQRQWIAKRKAQWLKDNGPCALCGSPDSLELDHVDPEKKVSHNIWSWSKQRRETELKKCRVLCSVCHKEKSSGERAKGERNGISKLTWEQVKRIRTQGENADTLAEEFGVHRSQIFRVRQGATWKP